jgi:hypothetical protein
MLISFPHLASQQQPRRIPPYDRLVRRFVERLIPWASLVDACFKRSRDEPADFFSLQRHKLVLVVLVELRTEIQRVDTGIISVHYEKVPRFSKQAVSLYDLSFGRGLRDPQLSRGLPTMVPASNRMIQSFFRALSGWIGTK